MRHLNSSRLCVVDIETTGKMPFYHDLLEVCVILLDPSLELDKTIPPFNVSLYPKRENPAGISEKKLAEKLKHALDPWTASQMFERWYEKIGLPKLKRLHPISDNWDLKYPFLLDWLDHTDGDAYLFDFFDPIYARDLLVISQYWNDIACFNSEHYPFTKQKLHMVADRFDVKWEKPSTPVTRCLTIAQCYKKLCSFTLPAGISLPFRYITPIDYNSKEEDQAMLLSD